MNDELKIFYESPKSEKYWQCTRCPVLQCINKESVSLQCENIDRKLPVTEWGQGGLAHANPALWIGCGLPRLPRHGEIS